MTCRPLYVDLVWHVGHSTFDHPFKSAVVSRAGYGGISATAVVVVVVIVTAAVAVIMLLLLLVLWRMGDVALAPRVGWLEPFSKCTFRLLGTLF